MIDRYKLYNGDCIEIMRCIEGKSVDMLLADIPFGVTNNKKDIIIPFEKLWAHYERIIKDNGCIALFAQGSFYVDLINSNRKLFRYDLVWDKALTTGFLNAKRMPLRQHEQIAIFYKKLPTYNPQFTEGKPLHSKGRIKTGTIPKNNNYGSMVITDNSRAGSIEKYPVSILSFQKPHPSITKHPTEKSIPLLEYLIKTYTNEGDIVLDNCMGSGTTGVACMNTNRKFIGIEIDRKYFEISQQRIAFTNKDNN